MILALILDIIERHAPRNFPEGDLPTSKYNTKMEILLFLFVALHSEGIITKEHSSKLGFPSKHTYKACFDKGFVYHLGLHLVLQVGSPH